MVILWSKMCSGDTVSSEFLRLHSPNPEQRTPRLIKNTRLVSSAINHRCRTAITTNCHFDCGKSLNGSLRMKIHKADGFPSQNLAAEHLPHQTSSTTPQLSWYLPELVARGLLLCKISSLWKQRLENKDPNTLSDLLFFCFQALSKEPWHFC